MPHLVVLSILFLLIKYKIKQNILFNFRSELLGAQPCWFALYQWRAEKDWLATYLTVLQHMPALFVMSLIQTAEHKMAAFMVVFFQLSIIDFSQIGSKTEWKTVVCLLFCKKNYVVFHRQDQKLSGKIVVSIFYMLFIPILLLYPHASLLQCPLTIRKQKIRPTTGFLIVNIINVHSMCWQGTDWFNWKFIQKIILLHTTTESPFCLKLHFSFQLTYLPKLFSTWYHKTDLSCLTFTQLSWITLRHHS